ncbi:MAG: hypothetical protein ACI8RZ_003775 [Myxococcota bacterium]
MSLPAISLPAEDLYFLTDFGIDRLIHPRLPSLSALVSNRGYLALHAANTPPNPGRIEERARWMGWSAVSGRATPRDRKCFSAMILRPTSPTALHRSQQSGRNLRAVDLAALPRGAVVAVVELIGEEVGGPNRTPTWFLGPLRVLPRPVAVPTDGWPCWTPWTLQAPAYDTVRVGWRDATRRPTSRRSAG